MADETWTGFCGLLPYDRDRLAIALRAAHLPGVWKGGDMVIANSVDIVPMVEIVNQLEIVRVPGKFKVIEFREDELVTWERKVAENKDAVFDEQEEVVRGIKDSL